MLLLYDFVKLIFFSKPIRSRISEEYGEKQSGV